MLGMLLAIPGMEAIQKAVSPAWIRTKIHISLV
jgi:hypothetical protein